MPGLAKNVNGMIMSLIALAILALSALLVVGHLRMLAQDTFMVLRGFATQARTRGQFPSLLAFAALWMLIFSLSYLA